MDRMDHCMCDYGFLYVFLIIGAPQCLVLPSRGLRQGYPLSPYLFILCTEVLLGLCRRAQEKGTLTGIRVSKRSPYVNHLFFVDDTMFFCKANSSSCKTLATILLQYEKVFGNASTLTNLQLPFRPKRPPVLDLCQSVS